jgi:hypothetical protein
MRQFNPKATRPARAVQAWQILVGKAMNRQTVTYAGLGELMFKREAAGVLDKILGHVAFYCNDNNLPPLTSIVVGKRRGTPGADIPIDLTTLDKQREKVYGWDWYNVYPPSEAELAEAYLAHQNSN